MKLLQKICLAICAVLILSSAGGYVYFRQAFKAPANYLLLSNGTYSIPFTWKSDSTQSGLNPHAVLLLPVALPGCPKTFYMQFDLGAPYSMFYQGKVEAIADRYTAFKVTLESDNYLKDVSFRVGEMEVQASKMKAIAYGGSEIDWTDTAGIEIIGTIGADLIAGKVLVLDYPRTTLLLTDEMPAAIAAKAAFAPMYFDERRVVLPAVIGQQETKVLFDSGSSAFELLTDKATWVKLAKDNSPVQVYGVNSWGNTLTVYSTASDKNISFGAVSLPLHRVHYIEGTTFMQRTLMRFSGMAGMVGNQLFLGNVIVLDTKNLRFGVVE